MNINNGDHPASPLNDLEQWIDPTNTGLGTFDAAGLTKREHFAAMAMQGFCANSHLIETVCDMSDGNPQNYFPKMAVEMADALLEELSK